MYDESLGLRRWYVFGLAERALRCALFVALLTACQATVDTGPDASASCALGQRLPCTCGTRTGVAACDARGGWGSCACAQSQEDGMAVPDAAATQSLPEASHTMDAATQQPLAAPASTPASTPAPSSPGRAGEAHDAGGAHDAGAAPSLPCDLTALLAKHCWRCHGESRLFGAPMSLVSWEDLQRPAPTRQDRETFAHALERVQSDESPMPPAPHPRLRAEEVALFAAWVEAGTPKGTTVCDVPVQAPVMQPVGIPKPDDCEHTYEVRAHGGSRADDPSKFEIPARIDDRQYQCFYFDAPYAEGDGLFWYEPILDNVRHLHHWILYATDNKLHEGGSAAPCNAAEPGSHFVAGWGPGTNNAYLPSDVALKLQTGAKAGLVLELHYFNDTDVPQEDASGVRFCTGPLSKRAHAAAVHTTGSEGICLEPGATREVVGTCNPRTDMGDIHIAGLWPHMHKRARRMRVTIKRGDGSTDVVHDAPFDFNAQLYYLKDDVVVHPGDSLETRCFYENDSTARVHFGEGTDDEMCYAFITAWPVGSLANPPNPLSELRSDLLNRCADVLSALDSCNGLADAL